MSWTDSGEVYFGKREKIEKKIKIEENATVAEL
jgi:hypothetical protein